MRTHRDPASPTPPARRSAFVPVGCALILSGFLAKWIDDLAQSAPAGATRAFLFLFTDVLRACFFFGVGFVIIGFLRNRKRRAGAP